jgi:hypothetical protein
MYSIAETKTQILLKKESNIPMVQIYCPFPYITFPYGCSAEYALVSQLFVSTLVGAEKYKSFTAISVTNDYNRLSRILLT